MYRSQNRLTAGLAVTAIAASLLAGATAAAAQTPAARYSAVAVNMLSTNTGAGVTPITIVVRRWSTNEERDQVLTTALEQGPAELLAVLKQLPVTGSVAPTGGVGFNIHYASSTKGLDGIERVVLLTDRPMSFWERRDAGPSTDYPFTLIELNILPSGSGEGTASVATQVRIDPVSRTLVADNYNDQPVRLQSVKRQ